MDFLQGLLERDPKLRLSAQDALMHPWVANDAAVANLPLGGSVVQVMTGSVVQVMTGG